MKKVAHKIYEGALLEEKDMLPRQQEDPFLLYNDLLDLRKPLKFERLFGNHIEHFEDKSILELQWQRATNAARKSAPGTGRVFLHTSTAISNHVMRSGKHYVTFTCSDLYLPDAGVLWFGIVRPLNRYNPCYNLSRFTPFCGDVVNELRRLKCPEWGDSNIHSCVYKVKTGQCQSTDWKRNENDWGGECFKTESWEGIQSLERSGKIGLLLDYDKGTLTVYKNEIKLGVMKEGLSGAYSWMVSVGSRPGFAEPDSKLRIKIERSPLPQEAASALGKRLRTE